MPTKVEYYISVDNVNFMLLEAIDNILDLKIDKTTVIPFRSNVAPVNARYIKVKAYNYGGLPQWHQGFGGDAFIFIDEITIK